MSHLSSWENNTWLKTSIAQHAPVTRNNAFVGLVPHLVGKVGLVMRSRDPEEISEAALGYNLRSLLCWNKLDIGMYYIWQFVVVDHLLKEILQMPVVTAVSSEAPKRLQG
nr:60S acidic ribosomal protein P0-1-like [Tanacetum cinerariifolium]